MLFHIYERYVVPASVLIPLFIAFINYKYLGTSLKIIFAFLVFSGIVNTAAQILAEHKISNLFIFHIYSIFEFGFISWFYKIQLKAPVTKIILVLIILFTVACIINFIFIQNNIEFNTYTRPIEALIIIGYCALFFNQQSQADNGEKWADISLNWINTSFLIYFAGSFFTFIFSNYLLTAGKHINNIVWGSYYIILIAENILFSVGFYRCRKQPITSFY